MIHTLVIWTAIAATGTAYTQKVFYGWRSIGEFANAQACVNAARELGLTNTGEYRCLNTGRK